MEIPEIKSRLTIKAVLDHYSYKPTKSGSMACPFHSPKPGTKKKTFQVYTDTNRYQCFHKDCTAGNGDVIDFIEHQESCSTHEAIEKAKSFLTADVADNTNDAHSDVGGPVSGKPSLGSQAWVGKPTIGLGEFIVVDTDQLRFINEALDITVLGGIRLEGLDRLRCTLRLRSVAQRNLPALRHSLDLYNDDHFQRLVRKTAERLEIGTSSIESTLYTLTDHLEAYRFTLKETTTPTNPKTITLTEEERKRAMNFLQEKDLMERTNELLGESGIVGEERNRQVLWLVYGSRKRPKPLHVICLGASGTGKTYLQEKVARFIPETEKFTFTASSENAFYYLEPYDLCHKLVLIEDMDGVQYLLYSLRELQTKSWISKVVPVKDAQGRMKTKKLEVFGPICLSGTTTKEKLYEDNANRCLLLHLDNSPAQQEAIMNYQRKLSAGRIDSETETSATRLLQHIQMTLEPVRVINPYAESLRIPNQCFKPLRTHEHYLQFIETVTWYHQYQRKEHVDKDTGEVYITTTLEDIETANGLIKEVLLTKSDELPKTLRDFFEQLKDWLKSEQKESFYSKALRTHFRMYPMKANRYINTLEQYGYLKKCGGNRKQGYEYEVTDWSDYETLKSGLNVLDELLESLKSKHKGKYNISVTPV